VFTEAPTDFRPVGTMENALVEKPAVPWWRYRRLLAAENGEVRKGTEFLESDKNFQGGPSMKC
jgi:hypothetical protein